MYSKRLLFVINDLLFFISHRLPLAIAAKERGFEVHIATPQEKTPSEIKGIGFIFHTIPLSRKGKNLFREVKSIFAIYRLMRTVKPDLVHLVTIKPVLYGGLVARLLRIPSVVVAISGLGSQYISSNLTTKLRRKVMNQLYRLALKHPNLKIIFQNPDDRQMLLQMGAFSLSQTVLIRGSGVDLSLYQATPEKNGEIVVAMISRLLKDKGVIEYVAAAKMLRSQGVNARFMLIGEIDYGNPTCIDKDLLKTWHGEGYVELFGFRKDIPQLMQQTNIIVLPSYREGLPKVLLEAAASGRAVVTTNVPGCRDAIEPNQTGLLVPVKDVKALASAIERLIDDSDYRQQLGKEGRLLAEREFSIEHVVAAHMDIYYELI
ncbi:glycosyltransferase family 4 protein [Legionella tucsonensis]|uniref:Glycosyl transferase, group 1 n=1 Tax=Legionella tucsonensis TaxID=40335 RepID=A0A0W0ZT55_9GAMM|nr:glycosyltransferase family 4 protein [Legionella tucsonensis]KTD72244.1 glycosyl transferase, group 1 [Legionella tucsonensis]